MGIFKKIFKKKQTPKAEVKESWYNNAHEQVESTKKDLPIDPGALGGANSVYISISHDNERR